MKNYRSILGVIPACLVMLFVSGCTPGAGGPPPPPDQASGPESTLFVQTAESGSFLLYGDGDVNHYVLTLENVPKSVSYFSNRPQRNVGAISIDGFLGLDGLFSESDPPNAAIVVFDPGALGQEVVIVELLDPVYDAVLKKLYYEAYVLDDTESPNLRQWRDRRGDGLPRNLGPFALFIDSSAPPCPGTVNPQCTD